MAATSKKIVLSVKPLGDAVMTIAVARALERVGVEARLDVPEFARGFLAAHGVPLADEEFIRSAVITIDIGDYLLQDPHVMRMPDGFRAAGDIDRQGFGHLSQWIGRYVAGELGIERLPVDPADVSLHVSGEQLVRGRTLLEERTDCLADRVVLVIPAAGSLNRVIPPLIYSDLFYQPQPCFRDPDATVRLLGPLPKGVDYRPFDTEALTFSLDALPSDDLPSVLAAAGCVVTADTGPYHITAAAKAGVSPEDAAAAEVDVRPDQVVLVCGSSNPFTLIYEGTQYVLSDVRACPVIPCGAHGYTKPQEHVMLQHRMVFSPEGEQSGCVFPSYATERLAPCMKSVSAGEIMERVRQALA